MEDQKSEEYIKYFTQLPDGWVIDPETNMACPIQETKEYIRLYSTPPDGWDANLIVDAIEEIRQAHAIGMTVNQYRQHCDLLDRRVNIPN